MKGTRGISACALDISFMNSGYCDSFSQEIMIWVGAVKLERERCMRAQLIELCIPILRVIVIRKGSEDAKFIPESSNTRA